MAAMKKHIELLEIKVDELEKSMGHQKELMTMMKDTMMNQKMILEMIVAKLNTPTQPTMNNEVVTQGPEVSKQHPTTTPTTQSSSSMFPMSRRVMV